MSTKVTNTTIAKLERDLSAFFELGVDVVPALSFMLARAVSLLSVARESGELIFASPQHTKLSGVESDFNALTRAEHLFPPYVADRFSSPWLEAVLKGELSNWDLSIKHKNDQVFLYEIEHQVIHSKSSGERFVVTVGVDVTAIRKQREIELQEQKSQLNYLSFHDPLTGLANRSLFYDRVNKSLSRAKRGTTHVALLLIDLDRFKKLNENLGHEAGDMYLKYAAKCLTDTLRDTDTVARLGGDEFAIVLENVALAQDIEFITGKILEQLGAPVDIHGHEVTCTASIGVSLFPKDGDTIDQLLKSADIAMSRAKAQGKNRAQFYLKAMTDNAVNYLLLENDLRKAIENDDLCLYYQPQVDLRTGRINGLEALVRWQHNERGLISPAEFIPLAEETGLIASLGAWVLKEACRAFHRWLMQGIFLGKVAVNLSPRQFRREHFEETVVQILLETQLSPEYLELEITESSAMENAAESVEVLNCLSKMGLSIAIDDFGTGYSSLAYLKRFPISKLKIDRSFINDIDNDEAGAAIAKSIIDLAHNMDLNVIAEGVERLSQSRWLMERGCDQVQGFYYSKPLSEEQLIELINNPEKAERNAKGVRLILD